MFTPKTFALGAALGMALTSPAALMAQDAELNADTAAETTIDESTLGAEADAELDLSADVDGGAVEDAAESASDAVEDTMDATGEAIDDTIDATGEAATDLSVQTDDMSATGEMAADASVGTSLADIPSTEELIGVRVYDQNDEMVGEISAVNTASTSADFTVTVDVGGFLGLGEKPVELSPEDMTVMYDDEGEVDFVTTVHTMDELEAMPEAEKETDM